MRKYYVIGRIVLQVEGEIEADSLEEAETQAEELVECYSPGGALEVTDQPDYEPPSVTELE